MYRLIALPYILIGTIAFINWFADAWQGPGSTGLLAASVGVAIIILSVLLATAACVAIASY